MQRVLLPGDPSVEITLRPSARARRVSLRVSALDGRVTLSLPKGMDTAEALAFAREKSDWIRGHLSRREERVDIAFGAEIPFRDNVITITAAPVRRTAVDGNRLLVAESSAMSAPRVKAFLKLAARADLARASAHYSARIGREFGRITLRDTRSRWGSCSARGDLMYSWRLVMAPPDVLDYVAAHEVAHLVELNHSAAYWAVVADICPDYREPRAWLRRHGAGLHRYNFKD